ncbi:MAG: 50S ribosomal protein L21 [Bacteroidales bacterium]|nr:MAG: 50S ribosomal protein L21 [Bacteroidales bacterium]
MYAIVDIAGQQFKVEKDKKVFVNRINGEVGSKVDLTKVLFIDNEKEVKIGSPYLKDASVTGKILAHLKDKKVKVFKKKRRKGYRVLNGHRQFLTELLIEDISEKKKPGEKTLEKETAVKKPVKKEVPEARTPGKEAAKKTTGSKPAAKVTDGKKTIAKPEGKKSTAAKKSTPVKKETAAKQSATGKTAAKKGSPAKKKTDKKGKSVADKTSKEQETKKD